MGKVKPTSGAFDDWAARPPKSGHTCPVCQSPYKETVLALLEALIRHKSVKGRREVYEKFKEVHPDFPGTNRSFENHLYEHVRDLWNQVRGRS